MPSRARVPAHVFVLRVADRLVARQAPVSYVLVRADYRPLSDIFPHEILERFAADFGH